MLKYILKRVVQFIPVFLGVTIVMFALENIAPGDPVRMMTGNKQVSPEVDTQIRAAHHLIETDSEGKPIYVDGHTVKTPVWKQYVFYLNGLLHGDLGTSYQKHQPVAEILTDKYPFTFRLALVAITIEAVVGIGSGILSAVKRYSFWDILVTLITSILVAMPVFWLGMLLQLFFGIVLKDATGGAFYLPISGAGTNPGAEFMPYMYYILPGITLASVSTAYAARIMRSQLLEVMNQDYIRTARAKGLSRRATIFRHALKNALIPVVTYIGMDFGAMLAGAILTETVFNWPGVGFTTYQALTMHDWPIVTGSVTVIIFVVLIMNLLVDISYAFLDPRIRYGAPKDQA